MSKKPRQRAGFAAFIRFFVSFEFLSGCALLLFLAAVYFVIYSLRSQPDAFREAVWDDQFNKANFDTQFSTLADRYEVDLSLWMPVQDKLRAAHVSAVRQIVRRRVVKKPDQNEYLLAMHTSGLKPDFVCLTHAYTFTKDYGLDKPAGAENLSRYTAKVDISQEPAGAPIDIEFLIYSWNAFQGKENQMFGAHVKPGTQSLSFRVIMPQEVDQYIFRFERFDSATSTMEPLSKSQVNFKAVSEAAFDISFNKPNESDGYFIRWNKRGIR